MQQVPRDGVDKGKVTAEARDTDAGQPVGHDQLRAICGCDLVIEAIVENVDEKARPTRRSTPSSAEHAIFCSNTSSLCITDWRRRRSGRTASPACTSSTRFRS